MPYDTENFNPRSPCGERRQKKDTQETTKTFQSTLPVRGATGSMEVGVSHAKDFNPRSPCGERLMVVIPIGVAVEISIHAPRAGSDQYPPESVVYSDPISIHAPRAGSDVLL